MNFADRCSFLLVSTLLVGASVSTATTWKASGPAGGAVTVLAVDAEHPNVVYADSDGLVRSADAGASWVRLPLSATGLEAAAALPASTVLVANGGVHRSPDGGAHWAPPVVLQDRYGFFARVAAFVTVPSHPATVYAVGYGGSIHRSIDAGASWTLRPVMVEGVDRLSNGLAVDPLSPTTLYAATFGGLARSEDGGETWKFINEGLTPVPPNVLSVAVDPNAPSRLYVGTDSGVFVSKDGGVHFTASNLPTGARGDIRRLSVEPAASTVFATEYLGTTYRSADRGASWQTLRVVSGDRCALPASPSVVLAGDGATAYAGTQESGALRSGDLGSTWRSLAALGSLPSISVALDPSGVSALFLTTRTDLFRSSDGGATWNAATPGTADAGCARFVLVAAGSRDSRIVYGVRGAYPGGPLYRSRDAGATWQVAGPTVFLNPVAIRVNPLDPNDVTISQSGDAPPGFPVRAGAVAAAATGGGAGVVRSRDGGVTFADEQLSANHYRPFRVLADDPGDPGTLYAAGNGLFRRKGEGPWQALPVPVAAAPSDRWTSQGLITGLVVDPSSGALTIATDRAGVFRSLDGGATWADASGNLPTAVHPSEGKLFPSATSLAIRPEARTLYLSASTINQLYESGPVFVPGGVYESADAGATWSPVGDGLPADVTQVLFDSRGAPTLHAVTASGLFIRDLSVPLRLDAIVPGGGSTSGGTLVLLSGDGFRPDSAVAIGGVPATDFVFFSPQSIRVRSGPGAPGRADVRVTNPDGSTAVLAAAFLYASWTCTPDAATLCLENGRFRVTVLGPAGPAPGRLLTVKSGYFWFDWEQNPQVVVKILDGRSQTGHYWVFVSSLTDAAFSVRVTDTESGRSREYANAAGGALAVIDRVGF